jgi:hypothetical protein
VAGVNLHLLRRKQVDVVVPFVRGSMLPVLDVRIAQLEALGGVHVTIDPHFAPEECKFCDGERPEVTSVRVLGNEPSVFVTHPLEMEESCHGCAPGLVLQAKTDSASDKDIRVEVCE